MTIQYTQENLRGLIPSLRIAIDEQDLDKISAINHYLSELIKREALTKDYIDAHHEDFSLLYAYIRESEELLSSMKQDIKGFQSDLKKKMNSSKSYLDVERL